MNPRPQATQIDRLHSVSRISSLGFVWTELAAVSLHHQRSCSSRRCQRSGGTGRFGSRRAGRIFPPRAAGLAQRVRESRTSGRGKDPWIVVKSVNQLSSSGAPTRCSVSPTTFFFDFPGRRCHHLFGVRQTITTFFCCSFKILSLGRLFAHSTAPPAKSQSSIYWLTRLDRCPVSTFAIFEGSNRGRVGPEGCTPSRRRTGREGRAGSVRCCPVWCWITA